MTFKSISIILIILGIILFFKEIMRIRRCSFIDGRVFNYLVIEDDEGRSYKLQIEYTSAGNHTKIFTSGHSSSMTTYPIGDKIKLLYDKNRDEVTGIVHLAHRFLFPYILIVIGLTFIIFSIKHDIQLKIFEWIHNL